MSEYGRRLQRSRKPGAKIPDGTIYVGRGAGAYGRWGNPFNVKGLAATALAAHFKLDTWKARQWAATKLYAHWIASAIEALPVDVGAAAAAELAAAGSPVPPTIDEIRDALAFGHARQHGRDVCCWCAPYVDCHGDILRSVAVGRNPIAVAGTSPRFADNFRCVEENRAFKRAEIRSNIKRRSYVKGWTAW